MSEFGQRVKQFKEQGHGVFTAYDMAMKERLLEEIEEATSVQSLKNTLELLIRNTRFDSEK